ncbi:T-cell-interacting, activating receptor on myeloid cells protein 1-like [Eublepharis macularius]|uniref:T-cell-interacting, activating receptor on myeloid cells protein 1-like n=1 Tax=Eublepharis macularius TaxID=481883 RepID=UPI00240F9AAF|nr:T-cell-interacting, activating receptor on myeloid cells protein 1-like [Eublepharis macularius]
MGYEAEFIISSVKTSDAGIYQCLYCFRAGSEPMCSDKSDEAYINITDPRILKPSIKVKPRHLNAVHSNVTLECQSRGDDLNFFLRKAKTGEVAQVIAPAAAKANFRFLQVRMEDAGSYICQYHHKGTPFVWSEPSDPVELILKDPSLVQPSITMRPKGPHNVGMNVTIECKGPEIGLTFSLHRSQNLEALQVMKPEGDTAAFSLNAEKLKDAGYYTCQYYHRGNRFLSSEPSDPVQVIVSGTSLLEGQTSPENIARLAVAGFVLLALGLIVAEAVCSWRRGQL